MAVTGVFRVIVTSDYTQTLQAKQTRSLIFENIILVFCIVSFHPRGGAAAHRSNLQAQEETYSDSFCVKYIMKQTKTKYN